MDSKELIIYCDGGARGNPGPSAAAFLVHKKGKVIFSDARYLGISTNNFAEYNAVLLAISWLKDNFKFKKDSVKIYLDSELVANQLNGKYRVKNSKLEKIFSKIIEIKKRLDVSIDYIAIPRTKNKLADHLVNKLLDSKE